MSLRHIAGRTRRAALRFTRRMRRCSRRLTGTSDSNVEPEDPNVVVTEDERASVGDGSNALADPMEGHSRRGVDTFRSSIEIDVAPSSSEN